MRITLNDLRQQAISNSLFPPTGLGEVFERLGFVQADPIRAPARAQDLILRHRVQDFHIGDLEGQYQKLGLEEDFLYAYGFMSPSTWQLLHPRSRRTLTGAEKRVLDIVMSHERIHPRELEASLGRKRMVNAWGGYSKATTTSLHRLHYFGYLRVAGREKGVRLYAPTPAIRHDPLEPGERLQRLALLIARILAPLPERSLREAVRFLGHAAPGLGERRGIVSSLVDSGRLASGEVEGVPYVWPAGGTRRTEPGDVVRFLAPFDPVVWDRRRFEHLWGWAYRFEAYTPPPKRKMGYYAMPMLWKSQIIGWVNVSRMNGELEVKPGFVNGRKPKDSRFRTEFEAEVERFRHFLKPREDLKGTDRVRQARRSA